MKKKILCGALLGLMGVAQGVAAQDSVFDDRWYVTAGAGIGMFDGAREVEDTFTGHLGIGRFVAPRWSWDAEVFYANPADNFAELNWSMYSASLVGRYHMRDEGALDFRRTESVSRYVEHIVDAAGDPPVSILVAPRAVAGEVHARVGREVGVDEALVIAEHRAHLARP